MTPTGGDLLASATRHLTEAGIEAAAGDAQALFLHAAGRAGGQPVPRHRLRELLAAPADPALIAEYDRVIAARADRQPVSQITGRRAFWNHEFRVTPDVLDPRPETELLVEQALAEPFASVLDLGTGSGAILISLLAERPAARGIGCDLSPAALAVARQNAETIGVNAEFRQSDWFAAVDERFDLIVSNPPYIALDEMPGLSPEVRDWEPHLALTDGGDGLAAYRAICAAAPAHLRPGGRLMVEIGFAQGAAVMALMRAAGLSQVTLRQDLGGRDRLVWARMPASDTDNSG
ncbi:peptide chain release factor N(5)-glutamine methyltransferase [Paracoccus limosus]|uniref:Release factor glutamine methyltransferase n=1 Tax=Paracoccus limosus TaxID=913252 RepID=A0A844H5X5_9RHOB|nr:peptide chain release factor N(5)-glutamine methyltransferase [Paracoccus limosus]MTH35004.1 peptide chain release factor N(5)-glutamine methyltransferase [Paracoccus limosus]